MSDYTYSAEIFLNELLKISSNLVWKNPDAVKLYEENCDSIEVEKYLLAVNGTLTFESIYEFSYDVLKKIGIPNENIPLCMDNRYIIPENLRDQATKEQIDYLKTNYEEKNNYYRMLNGLPDIDDIDFVYNTKYPEISSPDTPVHLLDSSQLYALEQKGYIEELKNENPEKKYLDFLTNKKIDIYTARQSNDYSILWIQATEHPTLVVDFKETYDKCRAMCLAIYMNKSISDSNTEYAGFIGLTILFSTITQMHRMFLDADITREFYDEDSLRYVYDSYGVPFYPSIPMEYHKKIVKNMNILISHKGSTRVFYDIFDIFGFSNMKVFEFYMTKTHRFKNKKPVFIRDENGNYDYRKMFEIKFSKVDIDKDPKSEITNVKNDIDYTELTKDDIYWIEDEDLLDTIYKEEYNWVESKYIGVQTTFNLMEIIYETSYYLKLILDNRKLLSKTSVFNNNINNNCTLFDLVIYASAIITRKYGYAGNIPSDLHEIGKVMGFNFKDDLIVIKNNIKENDYLKYDSQLLLYLDNLNVNSLDSVKNVYKRMTDFKHYVTMKMAETDDKDVYWAYYELYNTMMYSEYIEGTFTKSDGTTANTFEEMLEECNPTLHKRYMAGELYNQNDELSDTLYLLKKSCTLLKNIEYADNVNIDSIIENMFKLLDFFKSAKSDLTEYQIIYSLVSQYENIIKLMNYIDRIYDDYTSDPLTSVVEGFNPEFSGPNKDIDEMNFWIKIVRDLMSFNVCAHMDDYIDRITDSSILYSGNTRIIHITENNYTKFLKGFVYIKDEETPSDIEVLSESNKDKYIGKDVILFISFYTDTILSIIENIIIPMADNIHYEDYVHDTNKSYLKNDILEFDDNVKLLYDEVEEIIKYFLNDNFTLFSDLIKISEFTRTYGNDSELKMLSKLMISEYSSHKKVSEYKLYDTTRIIFDMGVYTDGIVDKYKIIEMLSNIIVSIAEDSSLELKMDAESKIHIVKDMITKNSFAINYDDFNTLEYVNCILRTIDENHVNIFDTLLEKVTTLFIGDTSSILDIIKNAKELINLEDSNTRINIDAFIKTEKCGISSINSFSDSLILTHEYSEE